MIRILTGLLMGAAVLWTVLLAPGWAAALVMAVASLLGSLEVRSLVLRKGIRVPAWPLVAGAALLSAGALVGGEGGLTSALALSLSFLALGCLFRPDPVTGALSTLGAGALALLIPSWVLAHALLLMDLPGGRLAVIYLLSAVVACDTAAYYLGTAFGRHRLFPAVSPHKSVEGFLAGLAGGALAGALFARPLGLPWGGDPRGLAAGAGVGAALALLGQMGDLAESLLKRDAGVKDSGRIIPGHGGILDRVDSLLLALPLFTHFLQAVMRRP